MKLNLLIIVLLLLFASCDNQLSVTGIVVDKSSKKPLDSVAVSSLDDVSSKGYEWVSAFTSPDGRFTLLYPTREIKEKTKVPFIFQKDGYGSLTEFFPREAASDTIYFEKRF